MRNRYYLLSLLLLIACAAWTMAILFPLVWLIGLSFKTRVDALSMPPVWIFRPTIENYSEALVEAGLYRTLVNSGLIASVSSFLALILGVPAAYAFSRFRFKGDRGLFFALLTTRMAPPLVMALPLFLIFSKLRLIDTYVPIMLVHAAICVAIVVWIMKGFFDEVPKDIDGASLLDGDSYWGVFLKQICPLVTPGLAITGFYCFVMSWGEFLLALTLTGFESRTFTVAIPGLVTPHGTYWGQVAAISTIGLVPALVFGFLCRKYIVRELTLGAIS